MKLFLTLKSISVAPADKIAFSKRTSGTPEHSGSPGPLARMKPQSNWGQNELDSVQDYIEVVWYNEELSQQIRRLTLAPNHDICPMHWEFIKNRTQIIEALYKSCKWNEKKKKNGKMEEHKLFNVQWNSSSNVLTAKHFAKFLQQCWKSYNEVPYIPQTKDYGL